MDSWGIFNRSVQEQRAGLRQGPGLDSRWNHIYCYTTVRGPTLDGVKIGNPAPHGGPECHFHRLNLTSGIHKEGKLGRLLPLFREKIEMKSSGLEPSTALTGKTDIKK